MVSIFNTGLSTSKSIRYNRVLQSICHAPTSVKTSLTYQVALEGSGIAFPYEKLVLLVLVLLFGASLQQSSNSKMSSQASVCNVTVSEEILVVGN